MTNLLIDILGWIGSAMLVFAYWRISKGKMKAQSFIYQFLNVAGSILLIVNTIYYGAYPSSAVNFIWVVIGLDALRRQKKLSTRPVK